MNFKNTVYLSKYSNGEKHIKIKHINIYKSFENNNKEISFLSAKSFVKFYYMKQILIFDTSNNLSLVSVINLRLN